MEARWDKSPGGGLTFQKFGVIKLGCSAAAHDTVFGSAGSCRPFPLFPNVSHTENAEFRLETLMAYYGSGRRERYDGRYSSFEISILWDLERMEFRRWESRPCPRFFFSYLCFAFSNLDCILVTSSPYLDVPETPGSVLKNVDLVIPLKVEWMP